LLGLGVELETRDLARDPLSEKELEELIGERDHRTFLNPRNELYRERKMAEKPPSRSEAVRLMAAHPNLIRRPIVVRRGRLALGLDEEAYRGLLK